MTIHNQNIKLSTVWYTKQNLIPRKSDITGPSYQILSQYINCNTLYHNSQRNLQNI